MATQPVVVGEGRGVALGRQSDALVVEKHTVWPDEYEDWSESDRSRVENLLHASPEEVLDLDYVRQHSGFARIITVTPDDLERVAAS